MCREMTSTNRKDKDEGGRKKKKKVDLLMEVYWISIIGDTLVRQLRSRAENEKYLISFWEAKTFRL